MLTSPISVTIDGTAHSLSRINQDNFSATYLKQASGLEIQLTIRHSREGKAGPGQMERHNIDLVYTTFDAEGVPTVRQAYTVMRSPRGTDPVVVVNVAKALSAFVTANAAAVGAWES